MTLTPYSMLEGITWPAVPPPKSAGLLAIQYQLEHSQWLPVEELERRQFGQAALVLRHALATIPHYRRKYGTFNMPGTLDRNVWHTLPLLERSEIQQHAEQMKSTRIPPGHGRILTHGSSGSTGRPLKVLGTDTTHFFWLSMMLREHVWHRRDLLKKLASIRAKINSSVSPGWGEWSDSIASGPSCSLNIQTDVDAQLDWLVAENPDYLLTYPSNLYALVSRAAERGLRLPNLCETRTFGEMLQPDLRERVRDVWNVKLVDIYSAEEVGYIALQCPQSEQYHIQSENLLVEILNEHGKPCHPGETGEVVITTLHNFAMPLIRYRIGDHAEMAEPCRCGRSLPVIRRIAGRRRNMLVLPDGSTHWPSFPGSAWIAIAPVRQFQLVQHDLQTIEIRLVCARPLTPQEEDAIRAMLTDKFGYPFNFRFSYQEEIRHTPSGKYEDFISFAVHGQT